MSIRHLAPTTVNREPRNSAAAPVVSFLYVVSTPEGRVTFSTTGPSDRGLVLNADGRWGPSAVVPGQRFERTSAGRLRVYPD